MKTTIKDRAQRLSKNSRETMRDCSMQFRRARVEGDVCHMVKMLILATVLRDCSRGYLEAV